MKLIVTNQTVYIFKKNKFVITINFYDDNSGYQVDQEIYIENEKYKNEQNYSDEVHNLIEALNEVVLADSGRYESSGSIDGLYSKYKIIRYVDYPSENLNSEFEIDIPVNPISDRYMPFFSYEIKYFDNEGICRDVNIED